MQLINNYCEIPLWLDKQIFEVLGGNVELAKRTFVEINSDVPRVQSYLGTYFPRSYAESYCIFCDRLERTDLFSDRSALRILDWGCGSGGDLLGFLAALVVKRPNVNELCVKAFDGNEINAKCCEYFLGEFQKQFPILKLEYEVSHRIVSGKLDFEAVASQISDLDIALTFKALGELIFCGVAIDWNPYKTFLSTFSPRLSDRGVICIGEIASQIKVMDCLQRQSYPLCTPSLEYCQVKKQIEYFRTESGNNWAHDEGECRTCAVSCPTGSVGLEGCHAFEECRACGKSLANAYYRDLLYGARCRYGSLADNLDAHSRGKEQERCFSVSHSLPNLPNDSSQLYWMISRPVFQPWEI